MTNLPRTAMLAGSTGLVGGLLVQQLLSNPGYQRVVSLVRRPTGLSHAKLDERVVRFGQLAATQGLPPIDDVFCALGTTIRAAGSQEKFREVDFDYVVALAHLGRSLGASKFLLVSALGANANARVFYTRIKGETELAVQQLGYPYVGIFRPSLLVGPRKEFRRGERWGIAAARALSPFLRGPLQRYAPTQAADVAAAMVAAAEGADSGIHVVEAERISARATT